MKNIQIALLTLFIAISCKAQVGNEYMNNFMDTYYQQNFFSGNVLVAHEGKIIFQKSYGKSSHTFNTDNNPETKFNTASISKQFTAFLIVKLSEMKKLNLEDPIVKYLDHFPKDKFGRITIHHLLNHSSGIPHYGNIYARVNEHFTQKEYLKLIQEKELLSKPGERFLYSSLGYYLLAVIAEKSTGKTYDQLLKTYIFNPAGMSSSRNLDGESVFANYASGYLNTTFGKAIKNEPYRNYSNALGGGSIISTTNDLFNWSKSILKKDLLTSSLWKKIFTPYVQMSDDKYYGYGWNILNKAYPKLGELKIVEHGGTHSGYRSTFRIIPSLNLVVIVLSNFGNVPVDEIVDGLTQISISGNPLKAPMPTPVSINESEINNWVGKYATDKYDFEIKATSKTLSINIYKKDGALVKGPLKYLFSNSQTAFNRNHPQLILKLENNKLKVVDVGVIKMIAKKEN